jgi:hypothetical protein
VHPGKKTGHSATGDAADPRRPWPGSGQGPARRSCAPPSITTRVAAVRPGGRAVHQLGLRRRRQVVAGIADPGEVVDLVPARRQDLGIELRRARIQATGPEPAGARVGHRLQVDAGHAAERQVRRAQAAGDGIGDRDETPLGGGVEAQGELSTIAPTMDRLLAESGGLAAYPHIAAGVDISTAAKSFQKPATLFLQR